MLGKAKMKYLQKSTLEQAPGSSEVSIVTGFLGKSKEKKGQKNVLLFWAERKLQKE